MELVADTSTVNGSVTDVYNFSGLLQGLETAAGFDLDFSVLKKDENRTVQAYDYLQIDSPSDLENLTATSEDDTAVCAVKTQEDGSSRLTVAFSQIPEGEYLNGTVHVTFSLEKYLQEGTEHTCFFALPGSQTEKLYQMVCRELS